MPAKRRGTYVTNWRTGKPVKGTYAPTIYSKSGIKKTKYTVSPAMRAIATTARLKRIENMIETKECTIHTASNVKFRHNQIHVLNYSGGTALNMFEMAQGAGDPMAQNTGQRIGDQIAVKGVMIRAFWENALSRSKVFYRFMVIKCAKGDTIDRSTLFKNDSNNKMIDQINTERFSIIAQKIFTVQPTNPYVPSAVDLVGLPSSVVYGGICTKTTKLWIPGKRFGRQGIIQYENGSQSQVKFFDYRLVVLCYDWYGTPQDLNDVGGLNELYTKVYFKDA